ncbi:Na+/H+ antiporter NhaC family protein [Algivirga pacifica]|uniref:Na+/H+ antiporter NhaC family protein n=1 Tax=Algivirga pacifica TaxID=1162670 RepID=A0ABP9D9Y3_9BACT
MSLNVVIFGDDGLSGSNQLVLIFATAVAVLMAQRLGYTVTELVEGMISSISTAMSAILILLMIGALAGTWLISGIVPAMIYYGLQILHPAIFLVAAAIICAIISVATGSSWTTIATVGVALIGIGKTFGMSEGVIAGAIISGAYFGDKMSPLSDTTNLAPAVSGTDLFTHIRYMMYTTVPSLLIALVIFLVMGIVNFNAEVDTASQIQGVLAAIDSTFNITPWVFVVPVFVVVLIVKKMPALPALLIGALLGGVAALIFQPEIVHQVGVDYIQGILSEGTTLEEALKEWSNASISYIAVMKAMYGDVTIVTDNAMVNELLSTSGMYGMLGTIWLIIVAMCFGGVMEVSGMLHTITESIIKRVHTVGGLVASTTTTCVFFNFTASDQYLAIVVPGKMFADTYKERGLAPENLSRTLEDSATVTSVLVPWNTCGAAQASALNVATGAYLPYAFFNIISPFMTMFFAYMNIKIRKRKEGEEEQVMTQA